MNDTLREPTTRAVGAEIMLASFLGLIINFYMMSYFSKLEKSGFYILCLSKTISNCMSLCIYLFYAGPVNFFYTQIGPCLLDAYMNQILGYGLLLQGESPNLRIPEFQNFRISKSQNLKISESQNLRISKSQNLRISESQNLRISQSQNLRISKSQNLKISKSQNLRISESQNLRISESQNLRISESQNLRISESQNLRISESQNLRISESQNLRISESQNLRISESQNLRISESQNLRISESKISGPATQFIITINRFYVICFSPVNIPAYSNHITVAAIAVSWTANGWFGTLIGLPTDCLISFGFEHLDCIWYSDCGDVVGYYQIMIIFILAIANNSMNFLVAIKLFCTAKSLMKMSSGAAKNRRKLSIRFFIQSVVQDWICVLDYFNSYFAMSKICEEIYCIVFMTMGFDVLVYGLDGLVMYLFNRNVEQKSERNSRPKVSDGPTLT
ncbi:Protein CBG21430 [Caenorhabditis briggsae]|uniref:Protein CBG21430 n=1 Tax=Caenorhabditis briggsae TaxID=6238 RepID=A8Y020_CAEBR|nr:Protein CBG21430 [Caenorhabditis briggsae]CAP38237.2 Protein CBG21430 [Caenorhabditis briggsae]